jgi:hypothetical protein
VKMGHDIPKGARLGCEEPGVKYGFIVRHRSVWPTRAMGRIFRVSRMTRLAASALPPASTACRRISTSRTMTLSPCSKASTLSSVQTEYAGRTVSDGQAKLAPYGEKT